MRVTIYKNTGMREEFETAHEVLQHMDGQISVTYTDTIDMVYRTVTYKPEDLARITIR